MPTAPFRAMLAAAALLASPAAAIDDTPTAEDLQRANRMAARGDRALQAGNLGKALESYERALQIVPKLPEGHVGVGHVQMQRRQFQQAHDTFLRALECYEEMGDELFQIRSHRYSTAQNKTDWIRGRVQTLESALERAQSAIEALATSPSPTAQREMQQIKLQMRSHQAELNHLRHEQQRLEQIEAPKPGEIDSVPGQVFFFIGNALLNLHRTDEAIEAWETCARKSPDFPLVHNNLAVGYWKQDRLDEALQSLRRAEKLGFRVNPEFKADLQRSLGGRAAEVADAD